MKNSENSLGWFYGKNGSSKNVVSKPFTMAEYKAEKAKVFTLSAPGKRWVCDNGLGYSKKAS